MDNDRQPGNSRVYQNVRFVQCIMPSTPHPSWQMPRMYNKYDKFIVNPRFRRKIRRKTRTTKHLHPYSTSTHLQKCLCQGTICRSTASIETSGLFPSTWKVAVDSFRPGHRRPMTQGYPRRKISFAETIKPLNNDILVAILILYIMFPCFSLCLGYHYVSGLHPKTPGHHPQAMHNCGTALTASTV